MKILFTGSDVLLLNIIPPQLRRSKILYVYLYRLFIRLSHYFVEEYFIVSEHLRKELMPHVRKDIKVLPHPVNYTEKLPKIKHKGFNVIYYCPLGKDEKLNKWLYGYDVFRAVSRHYENDKSINLIWLYGQYDMNKVYPRTDFYLRCNRHDGDARMVGECKIQGIPYYWSCENPDIDEIIKSIESWRKK